MWWLLSSELKRAIREAAIVITTLKVAVECLDSCLLFPRYPPSSANEGHGQ